MTDSKADTGRGAARAEARRDAEAAEGGDRRPALEGIESSSPPGGRPAPPPGASTSQTAAGAPRTGADDGMSGAYRKPEAAGDAAQPGPSLELPDPDAPPGCTGGPGGAASAGSGPGGPSRSGEVTPEQAERVRARMPDEETVRREARLQESIDEQDRPPDAGSGLADPTDGPPGLPVEDEQ